MSTKLKTWIKLSGALLSLSLSAACGGGGGGGGGATPTPTPGALDISATDYFTLSGTSSVIPGECLGFELTDANAGFTEDTTVIFTDSTGAEYTVPFTVYFDGTTDDFPFVTLVSDSVIRVGLDFEAADTTVPTGAYPCLNYGFGDLFMVGQSYGVLVADGASSDTLTSVVTVAAAPAAQATLGTEGTSSGSLATRNEYDYYIATSAGPASATVVGLLGSGANFSPTMALYTTTSGTFGDVTNQGYFMMIERIGAGQNALPIRPIVRHTDPGTEAGFSYTLNVSTSGTIAPNAGNNTCTFGATPITADTVFTVNPEVDGGTVSNYNPDGAPGCSDVNGGSSGVLAPGKDVAYRLTVPANTTVSIGGIPNGTTGDTVLYLRPATIAGAEATDCPAVPPTCTKAADIFGANGTDSFTYRNSTAGTLEFYLIVDEYGTGTAQGTSAPMTIAVDFQ